MGAKYTTQTQTGYNSNPPPDDGSTGSNNLITWANTKLRIGDPLLTLSQSINSALVNALDFGSRTTGINDTATASDHMKTIECTAAITETLPTAGSVGAGYIVNVKNTATATNVSIALQTATDTLEGTVNGTATLYPAQSSWYKVNSAGNGYYAIDDSKGAPTYSGPITSTLATGTAPLVVASTTPVANLSIGGNAATATSILLTGSKGIGITKFGCLNIAQNSTLYLGGPGSVSRAAAVNSGRVASQDITISELRVVLSAAVPASNSIVLTLGVNGTDTALTCTLGAGATTGSDIAHTVKIAAGSYYYLKAVTSATFGNTNDIGATVIVRDVNNSYGLTPLHHCAISGAGGTVAVFGDNDNSSAQTAANCYISIPPCFISYCFSGILSATGLATSGQTENPQKNGVVFLTTNGALGGFPSPRSVFSEGDTFVSTLANTGAGTIYAQSLIVDPTTKGAYPPCFTAYTSNSQAQATTFYMGAYASSAAMSATETDVQIPMPACTVRNLRVTSSSAVAATTTVITVRKNGADTALTATLTTSGTVASDLTDVVTFAAGDTLTVKCVSGATTGSRSYNATFEILA